MEALPAWRDPAFQPAALPLAQVQAAALKREYAFTSHLTLFENCAEQYRFFRELGFAPVRTSPILFGTLVHQTIEDIHKTVLRGEAAALSEERIAAWFDTNYAYLTRRERVYLAPVVRRIALEHVLRYFRRARGEWAHLRETEVDVSLVKDAYILTGKVDLIVGADGAVELVDFKSEKNLDINDPADREKLAHYRRQLEVYAHIVGERTGQRVARTHLYYTSEEAGNPLITFPADPQAIERTIAAFIALTSAGLAVALRELFVDFTGWLFIIWRHPFGVGDRIQIGTWAGDVVDIRWFQFTILEITNWVDADQSTGRVVHIPNGMVFREPLANYTRGFAYVWNEIPVRLTFDSDWRKAKAILLQIAEPHSREAAAEAERHLREEVREYLIFYNNFAPAVYTRGREFGILLTLRYLCRPRQRRGTEHTIWEEILTAFAAEPDIHFAYPTWRVEMGDVKRDVPQ